MNGLSLTLLTTTALAGVTATYIPAFSGLTAGDWNYIVPGGDTGCAFGDAYGFLVKKGTTYPGKVMIEFEGGGSCYSWESCGEQDEAWQGSQVPYSIKMLGMTNQIADDLEEDDNLAFPGLISLGQDESGGPVDGWTKIWVPHCTQDWHIGSRTAIYEDDEAQDDGNDDDDDDDDDNKDDDEEEDRSITWNHNGLANAQSVVDYLVNSIGNSDQILMSGCGLQPYTAGHWADELQSRTGTSVTVLSDSGVGLVPAGWVQQYFSNWGAGCVVSKLFNDNDDGTYDLSSSSFWSDTFSMEMLWKILPSKNDNVKWLLYADIADEQNQEVYNEMQPEDDNQQKQNEGGYMIKAVTLLESVLSDGKVSMWLRNSEQDNDQEEEQADEDEDQDNDNDNEKNQKDQDEAKCYQAGYNAIQLDNADNEDDDDDNNNNKDDDITFLTWIATAINSPANLQNQICQYCSSDMVEDCNGNVGGGQVPDACGNCPEAEGEGEGEGEDDRKDDDDGEGEGEGEGEYVCEYTTPTWYRSDSSNCIPSFQETTTPTSAANENKSGSSSHTSMAIVGGVVIVAAIAGFAFVNAKGNKGEKRRLVDEEKGSAQTY